MPTVVRPLTAADVPAAEALLVRTLGTRRQARLGALVDVLEGPGLVALDGGGAVIGVVTWAIDGTESIGQDAEIRVIAVEAREQRRGAGGALLEAAEAALRAAGVRNAWLVTTNDNLDALRFYQLRGWRLGALHAGAVDEARRTLKPGISQVGEHGIPIHDELVLTKRL